MEDDFLTLRSPAEGYYMDRGSKFLAYVFPVTSEEEATECLQRVKKEHPKARHYCTALRLHPDASLERFNDDGEPSGSAGRPMLGQLIRHNLTNVFLVVVRYFGGTKLGVPGLIEAYKTSAGAAIDESNIIRKHVFGLVRINLSYDTFPAFLNFCKHSGIPVLEESFTEKAMMIIGFPKSILEKELMAALHRYSQMDFDSVERYAAHLDMEITILPGENCA